MTTDQLAEEVCRLRRGLRGCALVVVVLAAVMIIQSVLVLRVLERSSNLEIGNVTINDRGVMIQDGDSAIALTAFGLVTQDLKTGASSVGANELTLIDVNGEHFVTLRTLDSEHPEGSASIVVGSNDAKFDVASSFRVSSTRRATQTSVSTAGADAVTQRSPP